MKYISCIGTIISLTLSFCLVSCDMLFIAIVNTVVIIVIIFNVFIIFIIFLL